jgi:hypothetical protein
VAHFAYLSQTTGIKVYTALLREKRKFSQKMRTKISISINKVVQMNFPFILIQFQKGKMMDGSEKGFKTEMKKNNNMKEVACLSLSLSLSFATPRESYW